MTTETNSNSLTACLSALSAQAGGPGQAGLTVMQLGVRIVGAALGVVLLSVSGWAAVTLVEMQGDIIELRARVVAMEKTNQVLSRGRTSQDEINRSMAEKISKIAVDTAYIRGKLEKGNVQWEN